jgi:crossover junction endodeoxyribonuclease RuvC
MRILGIDPGLQLCGYGVIDFDLRAPKLIDGGVIRLRSKDSVASRLVEIERELESILAEHKPQAVAIEQVYAHYAHPRTAIIMGHARGVMLLVGQRHGLAIHEYSANRVKKNLTGNGHAAKGQMQRAIQALWKLPEPPEPPDVADALAVALCCGRAIVR